MAGGGGPTVWRAAAAWETFRHVATYHSALIEPSASKQGDEMLQESSRGRGDALRQLPFGPGDHRREVRGVLGAQAGGPRPRAHILRDAVEGEVGHRGPRGCG